MLLNAASSFPVPGGMLYLLYRFDRHRLCGKTVWFRWPNDAQGLPSVDLKNENPALRTRTLLGLTVLKDLRPADDGRTWAGGETYNPDDGVNYKATMSI